MRGRFVCKLGGCSLLLAAIIQRGWARSVVVRAGQSLSELAEAEVSGTLWGAQGSLARIRALNPDIPSSLKIYAGQQIELPLEPPEGEALETHRYQCAAKKMDVPKFGYQLRVRRFRNPSLSLSLRPSALEEEALLELPESGVQIQAGNSKFRAQ